MYSATESSLKAFLAQPNIETSPAWELINGRTIQKPMPTLFHSRLQHNLVNYINLHTEELEAIQELRCIIPPYSPVPDIAVIACSRLPEEDGPFPGAPDWVTSSSTQSEIRVLASHPHERALLPYASYLGTSPPTLRRGLQGGEMNSPHSPLT